MSKDEPPLKSRKFIAYLVAEMTWKAALLVVFVMGMKNGTIDLIVGSVALAIVVVAGFIEALYIGGQAVLDKYIRVTQIVTGVGGSVSMKGIDIKAPQGIKNHPKTSGAPHEPEDRPDGGNL